MSYSHSDEVEKGYVIKQAIPVNASVAEGVSVSFTVSDGTKIVTTKSTMFDTTVLTTTGIVKSDIMTSKTIETTNEMESVNIEEFVYILGVIILQIKI